MRSLGWRAVADSHGYAMEKGHYTVCKSLVDGKPVYLAYRGETLMRGRHFDSEAAKAACDADAAELARLEGTSQPELFA